MLKTPTSVGASLPACNTVLIVRHIDMIIDNDPPIERHISVPKDMSQLSCSSFTAGIVEAVLDGLSFVRIQLCFSPFGTIKIWFSSLAWQGYCA